MSMIWTRAHMLGAVLVALSGCRAADRQLEGSLSVLLDLTYQTADLTVSASEVSLRFVRPQGDGEDVVLGVHASLWDEPLEPGAEMDLSAVNASGSQRATVSRDVLDDPRRSFPGLLHGRLRLEDVPEPGKQVRGEVSVTFVQGIEFGCGRTVFGNFEAWVP